MALLMFIYMICALRTNAIFLIIFTLLVPCFSLLAAAYWRMAQGDIVFGNRLSIVSGLLISNSSNPSVRDVVLTRKYLGCWCLTFRGHNAGLLPIRCTAVRFCGTAVVRTCWGLGQVLGPQEECVSLFGS